MKAYWRFSLLPLVLSLSFASNINAGQAPDASVAGPQLVRIRYLEGDVLQPRR